MTSFDKIIDVLIALCGLYLVYKSIMIKKTREIEGSILIGKTIPLDSNSDISGYIDYICPKAVVYGILICLCSTFQVISEGFEVPYMIKAAAYFIMFAVTTVFCILMSRAQKRFLIRTGELGKHNK